MSDNRIYTPNSSPTILEKIRRNARHEAYAKARMLGYDATEAAREAWRVDIFILKMVEEPQRT